MLEDEFGANSQANQAELSTLQVNAVESQFGDWALLDEILDLLSHFFHAEELHILDKQLSH